VADRLRLRTRQRRRGAGPPPRSLTASAKILPATRVDAPMPAAWHADAWFMRNNTGELRHAETWLGNSMGGARLIAAKREAPGSEPVPLPDDHPAQVLMAQLAGGVGGQAALLRQWGVYLMTPGVGFMCGFDPRNGGGFSWQVRSAEEIRLSPQLGHDGRPMYEVQTGDAANDWLPLDGGIVVKVHKPDPQRHWRPDSPVRGALGILSELFTLTQAIQAAAVSRLAGAGVFAVPTEIEFPHRDGKVTGFDEWLQEFMENTTAPIADRSSAAAYVPFVFQAKGEHIDKLKHITFGTPFDEHSVTLRDELLRRLATAMDMPARALTGEQENHWGKAITQDEGVKLHVRPNLELVCDGITRGYLLPGLVTEAQAQGMAFDLPDGGTLLAQAVEAQDIRDADGAEIIAWYDLSDSTAKPDRSDDTVLAYDRFEVGGDTLRAETGLSEAEPPEQAEVDRRLLIKAAEPGGDAAIQRAALIKLNVFTEAELPAPVAPAPPGQAPGAPGPVDEEPATPEVGGEPDTGPDDDAPSEAADPSPIRPAGVRAAQVDQALVAAADGLVHRALERAGNRLRNATRRARDLDPRLDAQPHLMHTVCNAGAVWAKPIDGLLDGAWDRVPEVAARLQVCPTSLAATLDDYTRHVIRNATVHSWDLLEAYMAAAPTLSPAEQVLAAAAMSRAS